jgi:hypothetical protein
MPDETSSRSRRDVALRIKVLDSLGQRIDESVDIEITPREVTGEARQLLRAVGVNGDVPVAALRRESEYIVTVIPSPRFSSQTQSVTIPASGSAALSFRLETARPAGGRPPAEGTRPGGMQPVVRGAVMHPDGSPVHAAVVRAYDVGLRTETPLGEARAMPEGRYEIGYTLDRLRPEGKPAADLIVRAYDQAGNELARSDLLCRAAPEAVVDLIVGNQPLRGASEYDALVAVVRPYLGETDLADLEREDVQFLVCSAAVDPQQVATLIVAHRLTRETALPDWLFYALGRQGVRLQLEAMVLLRFQTVRDAVAAAMDANVVAPSSREGEQDSLLEQLQAVLARAAFDDPRDGSRFSFGALLGTSLADRDLQEAFLARYLARPESPEEFWKSLEDDERFSSAALDDLGLTLLLGRLSRYRLPVLRQLRPFRERGELRSVRDLLRIDRAGWRAVLQAASDDGLELPEDIPGETPQDRLEHYITSLRAPLELMFPSDSLRQALTAAPEAEPNLARFISNAEDLDLYWTNIDGYLDEHRDSALAGVAASDREAVVSRVKGLQRLLRVSPRADHVRLMDAAGFDSGLAIARTPKRRFQKRFVETAEALKDTLGDAYMVLAPTEAGEAESREGRSMMVLSGRRPEAAADEIHASAVSVSTYHLQQYVNLHAALQVWPAAIGGPEELQKKLKEEAYQ